MILRQWMSKHNVYHDQLAEALGKCVNNTYRLLDRHVLSDKELTVLIDDCITKIGGKYKLVKSKLNSDGSLELKISLFPVDKLSDSGVKKTALQWIKELASTHTGGQVALKSGFKLSVIYSIASRAGIKFKKGK